MYSFLQFYMPHVHVHFHIHIHSLLHLSLGPGLDSNKLQNAIRETEFEGKERGKENAAVHLCRFVPVYMFCSMCTVYCVGLMYFSYFVICALCFMFRDR